VAVDDAGNLARRRRVDRVTLEQLGSIPCRSKLVAQLVTEDREQTDPYFCRPW
jgi:hypothetical protein